MWYVETFSITHVDFVVSMVFNAKCQIVEITCDMICSSWVWVPISVINIPWRSFHCCHGKIVLQILIPILSKISTILKLRGIWILKLWRITTSVAWWRWWIISGKVDIKSIVAFLDSAPSLSTELGLWPISIWGPSWTSSTSSMISSSILVSSWLFLWKLFPLLKFLLWVVRFVDISKEAFLFRILSSWERSRAFTACTE